MTATAISPPFLLEAIPRLRAWLLGAFLLSLYLPWGISYSSSGGEYFDYWFDSAIGGVLLFTALTAGLGALPVAIPLALFGLALWRPRSRALVWICRVLLVLGLGVLVWTAFIPDDAVVRRHLAEWELLWGSSGRYAALLVLAAALAVEVRSLVRSRAGVAPDPRRLQGADAPRGGTLHRAAVASAIAIPLGLVVLFVVATAIEIVGVRWDFHFYITTIAVFLALLVLYGRALARAIRVEPEAPAGRLAAAVVVHASAQLAAGLSVLIIGAPLARAGPPLVPAGIGLVLLVLLWTALPVASLLRPARLAAGDGIRLALWVLALAVVAHPLLTRGVVETTLHAQLLVAGTGWVTMQLLALTHWARARRGVRPTDALLAALPIAVCVLAVPVGMTVLHGALAFENFRM